MDVEIGHLVDAKIVGMSDDQRILVIEVHDIGKRYGQPYDNGRVLRGAWKWHQVIPKIQTVQTQFTDDSAASQALCRGNRMQTGLDGLILSTTSRGFWSNPLYQRGYVWTDADREHLLDSVFRGLDIGKFVFISDRDEDDYRFEVLDGQQRLTTLINFVQSKFQYKGYYWHQLSGKDRNTFENLMVTYTELNGKYLSEKVKAEIFLLTNVAGVPQTEDHLQGVRNFLKSV